MSATIEELWTDFWRWTERHPAGAYLFRGQADASPVLPKIDRPDYSFDSSREKAMFDAFERAVRPFLSDTLSRFELLALAQHHGAPTRLVDWSTTPLIAGWFSVSSFPEDHDAQIYALDVVRKDLYSLDTKSGRTSSGTTIDDPLNLRQDVYLVETAQVSSRITTQRNIHSPR